MGMSVSHGESAPPPSSGPYAYNSFVPSLIEGAGYTDPVFSTIVRRVSLDHAHDDIYARNMLWSGDERRYLHRTNAVPGIPDAWDVIDVATGYPTHRSIGFGTIAADGGFDPLDADLLFALNGREIEGVRLRSDGSWARSTYLAVPSQLLGLGGSINWLDAEGRALLVRYGGEPSAYVYDRANLAAGPYTGAIYADHYVDTGGYLGLSPDGNFVVGFDGRPSGTSGVGQACSWAIDHARREVARNPTIFWSLCGDHGSFISASDGRTYFVTYNCYGHAGVWRADVTNHADGLDEAAQMALPNNKLLLTFSTWDDFGHVSCAARGANRDWCFIATEDFGDRINEPVEPWHPYRQEIVALNVVTGEIRRLAHHRSRSLGEDYYAQPRVSCSWGGKYVGFSSNFNQSKIVDTYALAFGDTPAPIPPTPPSLDLPVTIALGATSYVGTVRQL
jgi:hypothetical protein